MRCRFRKLLQIQMLRSASVSQVHSLCMLRAVFLFCMRLRHSCLLIHVLHEISCTVLAQFENEISKDLKPRLERTGDEALLQPFLDYFEGKSFEVGTSLLALWEGGWPPHYDGYQAIKCAQCAPCTVWAML